MTISAEVSGLPSLHFRFGFSLSVTLVASADAVHESSTRDVGLLSAFTYIVGMSITDKHLGLALFVRGERVQVVRFV